MCIPTTALSTTCGHCLGIGSCLNDTESPAKEGAVFLCHHDLLSTHLTPAQWRLLFLPPSSQPRIHTHLLCKILGPKHQTSSSEEAKGCCQLPQVPLAPPGLSVAGLHQLWVPWHLPKGVNLCSKGSRARKTPSANNKKQGQGPHSQFIRETQMETPHNDCHTHTHKKTQQSNRYGVMDIKWQNLEI